MKRPGTIDLPRRNFLNRFCHAASAALAFPFLRPLGGQNLRSADSQFHLHPNYREPAPLDALLLKIGADQDNFVTEKYHDQIAGTLAQWTANLLESPANTHAIEKVLAPGFLGSSLQPMQSRLVRPGPSLEVHQITFAEQAILPPDAFLQALRSALNTFSKIVTAEFQVTRIHAGVSGALQTRVRYELVGTGQDFHREQRVGFWELEWERCFYRRIPSPALAGERRNSQPIHPALVCGYFRAGARPQSVLLATAPARSGLLAHHSRRRLRHRHIWPQWRIGGRYR